MESFVEYVARMDEARYGGSGGAFGRSSGGGFDFSGGGGGGSGSELRHQSYGARVEAGKAVEARIIGALRAAGWTVNPSKPGQDMRDKVDGWVQRGGKWLPLQVKFRETGNEIAMEAMSDWDAARFSGPLDFDGRDMVGRAKLYACLSLGGGEIRVVSAEEAKSAAREAVAKLAKEYGPGVKSVLTPAAQARITGDPASGRAKVMAFVNPQAMSSLEVVAVPGGSLWAA